MLDRTATALVDRIIMQFNKMAFVSGPRQVGKTTLAQRYQQHFTQSRYLNLGYARPSKTDSDRP